MNSLRLVRNTCNVVIVVPRLSIPDAFFESARMFAYLQRIARSLLLFSSAHCGLRITLLGRFSFGRTVLCQHPRGYVREGKRRPEWIEGYAAKAGQIHFLGKKKLYSAILEEIETPEVASHVHECLKAEKQDVSGVEERN